MKLINSDGTKYPSDAQVAARKAFGQAAKDRAEKARAAKQAAKQAENIMEHPADSQNDDVGELTKRIQELENFIRSGSTPVQSTVTATAQGLIGMHDKYILDPQRYPSPVDRLLEETRLQRYAFKDNYELDYNIGVSGYKTIDGVNTREPKFMLTLIKKHYDEDTGELTNGRYVVTRMIFHEDPEAAIVIAREQGLDVESMGEAQFLNEMRYLRMRDWLLESFYPPKPAQKSMNHTERVIGNKLVDFWEVNSAQPQEIPFNQLNRQF